jgi:hypothetical protein
MSKSRHVEFGARYTITRIGVICLSSGMAALLAAGLWLWQASQAHTQAMDARQRVISANVAVTEQAEAMAQQARAEAELRNRDPRWQKAQQVLNWPWLDTLTMVEQLTRAPVYLLAYKPDANTGQVTLEGEADTLEDALGYVQTLQGVPQFEQARLIRHEEARDAASGRVIVRFAVQLRSKERAV